MPPRNRTRRRVAAALTGAATALAVCALTGPASAAGGGPLLYVPGFVDNTVSVVDPATDQVTATVKTPGGHPAIIEATKDGSKLYVDDFGALPAGIDVIDTHTGATKTISEGAGLGVPWAHKLSPDGKRLYVVKADFSLDVIDTATDTSLGFYHFPDMPIGIEVSPDSKTLYVSFLTGAVGAYDAATGATIHERINSGGILPAWESLSKDGSELYVMNWFSDNTTVFDTATWKVKYVVNDGLGSEPITGANSPDGKSFYIVDYGSKKVQKLDLASRKIVSEVPTAARPTAIAVDPTGATGYVSELGATSNQWDPPVVSTAGLVGVFLAFGPSNPGPGQLEKLDLGTLTRTGSIPADPVPGVGVFATP